MPEDITSDTRILYLGHHARESLARSVPELTCVGSVRELVERDGERADCILCDCDALGSVDDVERISESPLNLPILVLADEADGAVRDALSAGATDYFPKSELRRDGGVELLVNRLENYARHAQVDEQIGMYEEMINTVPDLIYATDEDGRYVEVNDTAFEKFGYDYEETIGRDATFPVPDEAAEKIAAAIRDLYRGAVDGNKVRVEYEAITKDGDVMYHESHIALRQPDEEGFRGTVGMVRDISERKERQRELELYEEMIESVPDAVYAADGEGRFIHVNHAGLEMFGYDSEEAIGGDVTITMSDEGVGKVREALRTLLRGERDTVLVEYEAVTKDGATFPVEQHIGLRRAGEDGYHDVVGMVRDVTVRKEYEERLERQNERLEEFASVVSHDLRNPLSVAHAYAQTAIDEGDVAYVEQALDSLDRMNELIGDLLTLAKEGETVDTTATLSLEETARTAWSHVETGDATLLAEPDAALVADDRRLQQLFENLFRNAVEHAGADVTVRVGPLENGTGFFVADDGTGIPDEQRERVFELGHTTSRSGTGFGLGIVSEIVAGHGWEIDVRDSADGGARFEIEGVGVPGNDVPGDGGSGDGGSGDGGSEDGGPSASA